MENKFKSVEEMLNSNYDVAMMESTGLDQYLIWLIEKNFNITTSNGGYRSARFGTAQLLTPRAYVTIFNTKDGVKLAIHELYKSTREEVIETASVIMSVNTHDFYFSKGLKTPTEKEIELARLLEEWANRWVTNRKPKMANSVCGSPATPPPTATATTPSTAETIGLTGEDVNEITKAISNEMTKVITGIVRDLTSFRREIEE